MAEPIISIIVPVYDVEMYLRHCLESIRTQTFQEWECILVDDGSPDGSPSICDEFAQTDARFKVIHKKNGGVSSARNAGLEASTGRYIGFVDPDDWIEPQLFEYLHQLITEENADIAQVGYWTEYTDHSRVKHMTKTRRILDGQEATLDMAYNRLPSYLWNRLHRREIITQKFPDGRTFEDLYVYGHWLKNVNRMVIDPTPLYHYRMRKGSIVHANPSNNQYDYFLSCTDRMRMIESLDSTKKDENRRNAYINKSAVNACKTIARMDSDRKRRISAILKIRKELRKYPLPSIKYFIPRVWWRAKILRIAPRTFSSLMRKIYSIELGSKKLNKNLFD